MKKLCKKTIIAGLLVILGVTVWAGGTKDASKTISFAGSGGYPPFNYLAEDGSVIGFDVDVAAEIAKRLGKELDYKTTAWDGIIEGLRAGRYDGILGSMGITEERQKIVDFSTPYYYSGPQLIVRKDSGIKGIEDLDSNSKIGLVTGTTYEQDALSWNVDVKLYEDDNQTLMELINGRIDGVLTDRIVGLNAISKISGGENLTLAGTVLRTEKMGIAFNKKNSDLCLSVNSILADMQNDGTLKSISEKWFNGSDITVK